MSHKSLFMNRILSLVSLAGLAILWWDSSVSVVFGMGLIRSEDCLRGIFVRFTGTSSGFCKCYTDYLGPTCSIPKCFNGGRPNLVSRDTSDIVCECTKRFFGKHCQFPMCDGGFILADNTCQCFQGYHGSFCQHRCLYGSFKDGKCICEPGFKPPECELCLESHYGPSCSQPGFFRRVIFFCVVIGSIVTITCLTVLCVLKHKRNRRTKDRDREIFFSTEDVPRPIIMDRVARNRRAETEASSGNSRAAVTMTTDSNSTATELSSSAAHHNNVGVVHRSRSVITTTNSNAATNTRAEPSSSATPPPSYSLHQIHQPDSDPLFLAVGREAVIDCSLSVGLPDNNNYSNNNHNNNNTTIPANRGPPPSYSEANLSTAVSVPPASEVDSGNQQKSNAHENSTS